VFRIDRHFSHQHGSLRTYRKGTNFPPVPPRCSNNLDCYCLVEGRSADYFTRLLIQTTRNTPEKRNSEGVYNTYNNNQDGDEDFRREKQDAVINAWNFEKYLKELEHRVVRAAQYLGLELEKYKPG